MKNIIYLILVLSTFSFVAQSPKKEIKSFRKELTKQFKSPDDSPILDSVERKEFKNHTFYPINLKYRVKATFKYISDVSTFEMKTSTTRLPKYRRYGIVSFEIDKIQYELTLYQREGAEKGEGLFLPFTDATNGETTYGGGRYIDVKIPKTDSIIIDFNQSYNPYCLYSSLFSCPIPPQENDLDVKIEAGIKSEGIH